VNKDNHPGWGLYAMSVIPSLYLAGVVHDPWYYALGGWMYLFAFMFRGTF
jgi:hypothetical protein